MRDDPRFNEYLLSQIDAGAEACFIEANVGNEFESNKGLLPGAEYNQNDLSSMTVQQLRNLASSLGINVPVKTRKQRIIEVLLKGLQPDISQLN